MRATGVAETCCDGECFALRSDVRHCGECEVDCIATGRGDGCRASQCTCGDVEIGCLGTRQSTCCPPRREEGSRYYANLDQDGSDCGECGAGCDSTVSDHCDGGNCVCGDLRTPCEGAPASVCCALGADIGCVDITSDSDHCGACGRGCLVFERCEGSNCTRGDAACDELCEGNDICCNGSCCPRDRCDGTTCG